MHRQRILIFSNSYVPVIGGVQAVAHNLARELLARGHEVRVITNRYPVSLPSHEEIEGVPVKRLLLLRPRLAQLTGLRPDLFLGSLYFGPDSYRRLRKIFREFRPEVVNVHFPHHQIPYTLKLREEFEFRLIVSLHGHDVEGAFNAGQSNDGHREDVRLRLRAILQAADAVTAVSRDLLDRATQIEPAISGKSQVISNGIDPAKYRNGESYAHGKPYLLGLGRLVRKKGFDLLIEAFAGLDLENSPDLIIAGGGEEAGRLFEQSEKLGLHKRLHFFGEAQPAEVIRLMNGCLGVIVPSRYEPFGIVGLEALAAGKPLVATRTGGLGEFLHELSQEETNAAGSSKRNGHRITLVEPTVEGIATGLRGLVSNDEKSFAFKSSLPEKFTCQSVARRYEEVFGYSELAA